jgi:hypothetical protein
MDAPALLAAAIASDHLVLNASHNSLLLTRTPARLVVSFLETGRFETD